MDAKATVDGEQQQQQQQQPHQHHPSRIKRFLDTFIICCKRTVAFLFSHVGLAGIIVIYSIMGGFLFRTIELPTEKSIKREILRNLTSYKNDSLAKLSILLSESCAFVLSHRPEEFESKVDKIFDGFQNRLIELLKVNAWDGKDEETEQWSFAGALLFAVAVITTIGYGHVAPRTPLGRLTTIAYALIGIPLTFLYLTTVGNFLADCFRLFYKKICCDVCFCQRCRRQRQQELRMRRQKLAGMGFHASKSDTQLSYHNVVLNHNSSHSSTKPIAKLDATGLNSTGSRNDTKRKRRNVSGDKIELNCRHGSGTKHTLAADGAKRLTASASTVERGSSNASRNPTPVLGADKPIQGNSPHSGNSKQGNSHKKISRLESNTSRFEEILLRPGHDVFENLRETDILDDVYCSEIDIRDRETAIGLSSDDVTRTRTVRSTSAIHQLKTTFDLTPTGSNTRVGVASNMWKKSDSYQRSKSDVKITTGPNLKIELLKRIESELKNDCDRRALVNKLSRKSKSRNFTMHRRKPSDNCVTNKSKQVDATAAAAPAAAAASPAAASFLASGAAAVGSGAPVALAKSRSQRTLQKKLKPFENGTHSPISPVDVCIFSALPRNRTRGELKPAGEARPARDAPIPGETKSTRELRASKSAMRAEPTKSVKVKRNSTFGACESKSFACHVTPPSRRLSLQSGEQPELGFENLAQRFRINMMSQRDSEDSFVTAHGDSMYFADESDLFGSNFRAANLFHRQKTKSTDDQERRLIPRSSHLEPWPSAMHGGASVPTLVVTQESRGFDPGEKCKNRKLSVPVYVCLIIIAGYLFAGALLFATWEGWDWLTGYYFCFVTLSTVGFGDIVPGTELKDWASHEKLVLCALWLAFGLSLLAMCFNLMQDQVKDICTRIGRRIGLLRRDLNS